MKGRNHFQLPQAPTMSMHIQGHQFHNPSTWRRDSGSSMLPLDSSVSQESAHSNSSSGSMNKLHRRSSVRIAAKEVARVFIACFIPRHNKNVESPEDSKSQDSSISTTISTVSGNSHSRFKINRSYSRYSMQEDPTKFSIADIYKATGNFSTANIIGQGGFGIVYKGELKDGTLVAIKRAKKNIYDKHIADEFKSEIQTLSKVEHLSLVRFLGYLEHEGERIIVVEYISNGTLREHLDGTRGDGLEIAKRLDIAIDVAHAITYLHMYTDHPIIHRDIKASNILITDKLRAKVADFGFARQAANDPDITHISTQIKGTAGYLDPEYIRTLHLTEKSDVYSFGVLLVELVTGRRPIEPKREITERVTARWAIQKFKKGDAALAMDPRLRRSPAAILAVGKVLELASECLASSRPSRPSMKECAEILWGVRRDFREMGHPPSSSSSYCNENVEISSDGLIAGVGVFPNEI